MIGFLEGAVLQLPMLLSPLFLLAGAMIIVGMIVGLGIAIVEALT